MNVRRATPADARMIAGIHVRGWQWAYRGLIPDAFLAALSIETRERTWRTHLDAANPNQTWLAEANGAALGFITCGPTNDPTLPASTGEVFALYQEQAAAGTGVGRALMAQAVTALAGGGLESAVLWVLEGNERARRFYEAAGWRPDGVTKTDERADHVRHEVRYRRSLG
jgi:GNAT superfamily N-acetyltransferase